MATSKLKRAYYSAGITDFVAADTDSVTGALSRNHEFVSEQTQVDAWRLQIEILQPILKGKVGNIWLEYAIPRMGKRIDAVVITGACIYVLEFKVGEKKFLSSAIDQVWDYALDLKNFHETSRDLPIVPVLVATDAPDAHCKLKSFMNSDRLYEPLTVNSKQLKSVFSPVAEWSAGKRVDTLSWERGRYCPTPTIIEAAMALYRGHSVEEISRSDASAINLSRTSEAVDSIIAESSRRKRKSICFVTGVPGAGKTLVGLNIATKHQDQASKLHSVFLSGNGPLVRVLREALARDKILQEAKMGNRITRTKARSAVQAFIQNVHNFRDECLRDSGRPPIEHVTIFDEAQRAWNLKQTANFMQRRKRIPGFNESEPEFLISCLDRHRDWAVIVCLVGGGQEIHTGEAGISEWIDALKRQYRDWDIHLSSRLTDSEYGAGAVLRDLESRRNVHYDDNLHLKVSMRSFRAENVSLLVKQILDLEQREASATLRQVSREYPIVLTRDLTKAKEWLREKARGTERYGIVVSSQAERLKPHAIDVKTPVDPINWFLGDKTDVRSSYYLEDVATQFNVQGLELDWACVTWDADFRYTTDGWDHWSFHGSKWKKIRKDTRQVYLKNAYRVLLTRARQGMVIVVPPGDKRDPTRKPSFYDSTFNYLQQVGFPVL